MGFESDAVFYGIITSKKNKHIYSQSDKPEAGAVFSPDQKFGGR